MTGNERFTRARGAIWLIGLAMLLAASPGSAGERRYYECTLQRVLSSGGDVVLLLCVEDGQVREHALKVASEPYTTCRMKEHSLKVDGTRLSGPMQIQVGPGTEKLALDVALDKGGTYLAAYGCPDPPRKVEGSVTIEGPRDAAGKQWGIWLQQAFGPNTALELMFNVDRQAKTLTALPAIAAGYNRGRHPVDASKLAFDGTKLDGEVGITIVPFQSSKFLAAVVPAHRQSADGLIKLKAALDGGDNAGSYSAVFGIEKQRRGQVSVRPATQAQMRAWTAPVLSPQTPWRVWLVTGPRITKGRDNSIAAAGKAEHNGSGAPELSGLPPADWNSRDYDDSLWGRYMDDLFELIGGYGVMVEAGDPALLCLRTRFGVSDPARAADVKVTVEYLGGAVVYVNGVEVGRSHLPEGKLDPHTPAANYSIDAYTAEDGVTPLPGLGLGAPPEARWLSRYQARVRTMTVSVPARVLVSGANVLALELHRAAVSGPLPQRGWSHLGIREVKVTGSGGAGLVALAEALKGTRVWSAEAVEQVTENPFPRFRIPGGWSDQSREVYNPRGRPVTGIAMGNPFDPVVPLRILLPRNGVGHGQAVLSDPDGLRGVGASVADFKGPGGAVLPAGSARLRFAAQGSGLHWCDDLLEKPAEGAKTIPVWLEVQAPKNQPPGWYTSLLSLEANGKTFRVPVQVFLTGFTVPDAKDLRSLMGVMHSPDAVADAYQVRPWSEEHFKLMARSLEMAGQLGNDIMYVPVIIGTHMGHKTGLIRWVKTEKGLQPDFRLFEKYLDLYLKYCAPPKAISLYVWSWETVKRAAEPPNRGPMPLRTWTPARPLEATEWDPQTGATANVAVPTVLDEGAEAFWKPMLDGVHAIVKKRGWPDRVILLGCPGDYRPSPKTGELLRQWAPYARWDIYSHFVGDPSTSAAGKMIAAGNFEVGLKEYPGGDESLWLKHLDYLDMPLQRAEFYDQSPPMSFRTLPMLSGRLARLGLDFWPENVRYRALIWGVYPIRVAGRGPDGPVPTVRLQMMREAVQDFEARLTILDALARLPAEEQKPLRAVLDDLHRRMAIGGAYLSQMELNLDWPGYAARVYRAAEELSGTKTEARWDRPPAGR
ncbi:MAG: glycoside hydrolase domain-containing protein [Thermoguttaceae bacterium]